MKPHKANLWTFLKNRSNEIRTNEIRIRREFPDQKVEEFGL